MTYGAFNIIYIMRTCIAEEIERYFGNIYACCHKLRSFLSSLTNWVYLIQTAKILLRVVIMMLSIVSVSSSLFCSGTLLENNFFEMIAMVCILSPIL